MKPLTEKIINEIEKVVNNTYYSAPNYSFEIAGRSFFNKCCGQGTIYLNFYKNKSCGHKNFITRFCICECCLEHDINRE